MADSPRIYRFGAFRFDVDDQRLWREGRPIDLEPKAAEVLLILLEADGKLVRRLDLDQKAWADAEVGDGSLEYRDPQAAPDARHRSRRAAVHQDRGAARLPVRRADRRRRPPAARGQRGRARRGSGSGSGSVPVPVPAPGRPSVRAQVPVGRIGVGVGVIAVVGIVALTVAPAALRTPAATPRVVRFSQLSHDGQGKSPAARCSWMPATSTTATASLATWRRCPCEAAKP